MALNLKWMRPEEIRARIPQLEEEANRLEALGRSPLLSCAAGTWRSTRGSFSHAAFPRLRRAQAGSSASAHRGATLAGGSALAAVAPAQGPRKRVLA